MTRRCDRRITATITFDLHPDFRQANLFDDTAQSVRHEPFTIRGGLIYMLENEEQGMAQYGTAVVTDIREE